jgi:hypothetical protein
MQSQKRTPSQSVPASKLVTTAPAKRADSRTKPVEIDAQSLRHIAGGSTDLPKKYW